MAEFIFADDSTYTSTNDPVYPSTSDEAWGVSYGDVFGQTGSNPDTTIDLTPESYAAVVADAALTGRDIPANMPAPAGFNLQSIIGVAGAVFKALPKQGGGYSVQPANAQAQAQVAAANQKRMMSYGAIAAVLYALMS